MDGYDCLDTPKHFQFREQQPWPSHLHIFGGFFWCLRTSSGRQWGPSCAACCEPLLQTTKGFSCSVSLIHRSLQEASEILNWSQLRPYSGGLQTWGYSWSETHQTGLLFVRQNDRWQGPARSSSHHLHGVDVDDPDCLLSLLYDQVRGWSEQPRSGLPSLTTTESDQVCLCHLSLLPMMIGTAKIWTAFSHICVIRSQSSS